MDNNLIYLLFLAVPFVTVLFLLFVASFYKVQKKESIIQDIFPIFKGIWNSFRPSSADGKEPFTSKFLDLFQKAYNDETLQVSENKNKYYLYKILILAVVSSVPFLMLVMLNEKDLLLGDTEWSNIYLYTIVAVPLILAYLLNKYINVRHYRDLWITHSKIKSHIDWRMMVFIKEYETQKTKMKPEESEALLESLQKSFIDDMCEFYNTSSIEVSEKVMSKDENMFQEILSIFSKENS
ncbi:MAG: hypothetical protein IKE28_08605 [Solobacterium sp.]|nr:hypothetical protein [Solobacterium sp.]